MTKGPSKNARQWVYRRDGFTCQAKALDSGRCDDLTIHHLLPRGQGGSNRRGNLLTVCNRHHRLIHSVRWHDRVVELGLLRETEPPPPPAYKITEARAAELGLPWGVPGARRMRADLIASGRVKLPDLPDAGPAPVWPPPVIPPPPRRRSHARPPAPPAEWTDPFTGEAYVLTPRGARPAPPVHSDDPELEAAS